MLSRVCCYVFLVVSLIAMPGIAGAVSPLGEVVESSNVHGLMGDSVGATVYEDSTIENSMARDAKVLQLAYNDSGRMEVAANYESKKSTAPTLAAFTDDDFMADGQFDTISDPLEPWNRAMFAFNDKMYFWLMKPLAQTYGHAVPEPFRISFRNFFHNAMMPLRLVNCLFQGKFSKAGKELARFGMNSTIGIFGLGDVAGNNFNIKTSDEDFGQTFGQWGIGHGFYFVMPIFGPSSARDAVGFGLDNIMNPARWIFPEDFKLQYSINLGRYVNQYSLEIGDYESLKNTSVEPYIAVRNAYYQYRQDQQKN